MATPRKLDQPPEYWDRLFAPSSCLAIITTVDAQGRVNAASYGTCTRVHHQPVYIAFTTSVGKHTADNIAATGQFTVNLPRFDAASLAAVRVAGLPFAAGVSELEKAGLTALAARMVRPPRILECPRHFECEVEWTRQWAEDRLMVCGKVLAASVDEDCVDEQGFLIWDRARSAHFCGAPYHNKFVAAYEVMAADNPYQGPEVDAYVAHEDAMLKGEL